MDQSTNLHSQSEINIEKDIGRDEVQPADPKVIVAHPDAALDFLQSHGGADIDYTEAEARRVLWKIDLVLMPILLITFVLGFLDKGVLSNASVFGLKQDAHLEGQQYSWVASIFYFGYMVGQPITSYMVHRVSVGKFLGVNVLGWGVSILLSITATNFAGLATARFFLGLFEGSVTPCFVLITSQYYTRKEHSLRACIWWSGNAVGSFFGDLIAYGLGHGHGPLKPWKYMFITFGAFSVVWSFVVFFFLPDSPWTVKSLSEKEKRIAVLRVRGNHVGIQATAWKWKQARSIFVDPQAWIFFCIAFIQCLPSGGLSAFNKLILTGLGYTNLEATIWSMPEHAIQLVSVILAGVAGTYLKNFRCIVMIISNIPPLVGSLMVYYLPTSHKLTRLAGVYILFTNTVSYIMVISLIASNVAGMTRKTTMTAMYFCAYSVGNLVAPHLFIDKEAPRYPTGFRGMIASFVALIVLALILMIYVIWENRRRDKLYGKADMSQQADEDFLDQTDKEQPFFRYAW